MKKERPRFATGSFLLPAYAHNEQKCRCVELENANKCLLFGM